MTTPKEARADRDLLIRALRAAAPLALEHFRPGKASTARSWTKSDGSSVTEADMAVNAALKAALLSARPDYGWLSEEDFEAGPTAPRLSRERVFVVDPIDGTRSFMEGAEAFCLSAAVVSGGAPVAAAVFAPAMGRMYEAALDDGARLNDRDLFVGEVSDPPNVMARSRDLKDNAWGASPPQVKRRYLQPLAHRLCAVAAGEADGLIVMKQTREWDVAAADLIAREAGYRVSDIAGATLSYNSRTPEIDGLLAAPAALHEDWLARRPLG